MKRGSVHIAKASVEDAVRTAIQQSPMKKELLKDRRFRGMLSLNDDDSDTAGTDSECTLCSNGTMKRSNKGYGCSNWKPNDPETSCSNFKPFQRTTKYRKR